MINHTWLIVFLRAPMSLELWTNPGGNKDKWNNVHFLRRSKAVTKNDHVRKQHSEPLAFPIDSFTC